MTVRPVNYEQTDRRWKNILYSNHNDSSQTIGSSGCGPTCAAMVIATLKDSSVTPIETCSWAVQQGYRTDNNGTQWGYFRPQMAAYGLNCDDYTSAAATAVSAVEQGYLVIALALKGLWTSSGHYILAYGTAGNYILVNDPNSTSASREKALISTFKAQCSKFWIVREKWRDEAVEINTLEISNLDTGKDVTVNAVNIDGSNYVQLRDLEKLFPVVIGNVGKKPTMKLNYK